MRRLLCEIAFSDVRNSSCGASHFATKLYYKSIQLLKISSSISINLDLKMRIFQSIRNYFALAGLNPNQTGCKHPFNIKSVAVCFAFGVGILFNIMSILYEASDFAQYTQTLCSLSTGVFSLFYCLTMMQRRRKIFEFIQSIANIINKRE